MYTQRKKPVWVDINQKKRSGYVNFIFLCFADRLQVLSGSCHEKCFQNFNFNAILQDQTGYRYHLYLLFIYVISLRSEFTIFEQC